MEIQLTAPAKLSDWARDIVCPECADAMVMEAELLITGMVAGYSGTVIAQSTGAVDYFHAEAAIRVSCGDCGWEDYYDGNDD